MANIWEKAISILAGNLNSGLSNLIKSVLNTYLPFGQVSDATNETPRNKKGSMIPNRFKGPSILEELLF